VCMCVCDGKVGGVDSCGGDTVATATATVATVAGAVAAAVATAGEARVAAATRRRRWRRGCNLGGKLGW
jgi:hypothetical protein